MATVPEENAPRPYSEAIARFVRELNAYSPNHRWDYYAHPLHDHIKMHAERRWKELNRPEGKDEENWAWAEQYIKDTYAFRAYPLHQEFPCPCICPLWVVAKPPWTSYLSEEECEEITNAVDGRDWVIDREAKAAWIADGAKPINGVYPCFVKDQPHNKELRRAIKVAVGMK